MSHAAATGRITMCKSSKYNRVATEAVIKIREYIISVLRSCIVFTSVKITSYKIAMYCSILQNLKNTM